MDEAAAVPQFRLPDDGCDEATLRRLAAWATEMSAWGARTIAPDLCWIRSTTKALKAWQTKQEKADAEAKGRKAVWVLLLVVSGSLLSQGLAQLLANLFS